MALHHDRGQAEVGSSSMSRRGRAMSAAADRAHLLLAARQRAGQLAPRAPPAAGTAAKTRSSVSARRARARACARRARGSRARSWSGRAGGPPARARCRAPRSRPSRARRGAGRRTRCGPARSGSSPEIARSVVVLPAPLPPISATVSPARTSSETRRDRDQVAVAGLDPVKPEERGHTPRRGRPRRPAGGWRRRPAAPPRSSRRSSAPRCGGTATSPRACCAR